MRALAKQWEASGAGGHALTSGFWRPPEPKPAASPCDRWSIAGGKGIGNSPSARQRLRGEKACF
jgi:hypothetical protein